METFNDPEEDDGIYCDPSGYLFGHPANADCEIAQNGIGEGLSASEEEETREFLGVGAQPRYNGQSRYNGGFPIEQTPFNWTSGRYFYSDFIFHAS